MATARLRIIVVAQETDGDAYALATCKFYQPGTATASGSSTSGTPFAGNLYAAVSGGSPISTTQTLGSNGTLVVWTTSKSRVDVGIEPAGGGTAFVRQYEPSEIDPADVVTVTNSQVLLPDGTLSAPGQTFTNDTNTGRYRISADTMADVVGGAISIRHRKGTKFTQVLIGDDVPYSEGIQFYSNGQADADDGDVVLNDFIFTTASSTGGAGVVPDQGAARFLVYQIDPDSDAAIRSTEHHVVRAAGSSPNAASYCWAIQIGCHSEEPGDGEDKTMGAMIHSSDAPPYNSCVRADTGVWIGGERGWIHPILVKDIDTTTTLADLNQYGRLLLAAAGGSAATNSYSWVGDENTGMSRIAADTLILAAGGNERVRVVSTGTLFSGDIVLLSGVSNGAAHFQVGRVGVDGQITSVGAANDWMTGSAQGDLVFRAETQRLLFGSGTAAGLIVGPLGLETMADAVLSPSQITANQNDYAPTNFATRKLLRLSSDASRDITGFSATGVRNGERKTLVNVGLQNIVLKFDSASSAAANRIYTAAGTDFTLSSGRTIEMFYDAAQTHWRLMDTA